MKNWRITLKDKKPYIEFLDEFSGKVILIREFHSWKQGFDSFHSTIEPCFELFDGEEVLREDTGDIYVIDKMGELVRD